MKGVMENKFIIYIMLICVVTALAIIGCDWFGAQKPEKEVIKVTLGLSATSLLPSLVHVASEKGYFLEEGLDIEIKGYPTGKHALAATLAGEIDMGTVADTPIVFNSFKRHDFSVFGTIVDSAQHTRALGRKDRGINTLHDLIGKKIATTIGTTAHYFMEEFFLFNNMDSSEVELVNMKPREMVKAIINGEVDAIFAWEPNVTNAMNALGDNGIHLHTDTGYMATFNLVSKNGFIRDNPELIIGVIKGLVRAEDFVSKNREESVDIIAAYLKTEPKVIDALWGTYKFRISLSQILLITLENQARWAIGINLTDKTEVPNYLDYIYLDALEEVDSDAVTIIH